MLTNRSKRFVTFFFAWSEMSMTSTLTKSLQSPGTKESGIPGGGFLSISRIGSAVDVGFGFGGFFSSFSGSGPSFSQPGWVLMNL